MVDASLPRGPSLVHFNGGYNALGGRLLATPEKEVQGIKRASLRRMTEAVSIDSAFK